MTTEETAAFRFADTVDPSNWDDEWADEYGAFVASLHGEEMALSLALSPAAKAQTYLALLPNSDFFIVLHGLHRWVTSPPSRSVNEGRMRGGWWRSRARRSEKMAPNPLTCYDSMATKPTSLVCSLSRGLTWPGWQIFMTTLEQETSSGLTRQCWIMPTGCDLAGWFRSPLCRLPCSWTTPILEQPSDEHEL
jgi:hypothetical protein